jgi:hypothetical protein
MEIQNKNDELQRELLQLRRDNAEKLHLQKTIEKYVKGSTAKVEGLLIIIYFNSLQKQQIDMNEKNRKLQKKLEEILPESIKDEGT